MLIFFLDTFVVVTADMVVDTDFAVMVDTAHSTAVHSAITTTTVIMAADTMADKKFKLLALESTSIQKKLF